MESYAEWHFVFPMEVCAKDDTRLAIVSKGLLFSLSWWRRGVGPCEERECANARWFAFACSLACPVIFRS